MYLFPVSCLFLFHFLSLEPASRHRPTPWPSLPEPLLRFRPLFTHHHILWARTTTQNNLFILVLNQTAPMTFQRHLRNSSFLFFLIPESLSLDHPDAKELYSPIPNGNRSYTSAVSSSWQRDWLHSAISVCHVPHWTPTEAVNLLERAGGSPVIIYWREQ